MFCTRSLEKKGDRELLQSRKSLLLTRKTTHFLLVLYHLHSPTSHSFGIKTYIQNWSFEKIKWRTPKRVAFILQYPLRWKKVFSETLVTAGLSSSLRHLYRSWGGWATTTGVSAVLTQHDGGAGLGQNSNLPNASRWKTLLASSVSSSEIAAFYSGRKQQGRRIWDWGQRSAIWS